MNGHFGRFAPPGVPHNGRHATAPSDGATHLGILAHMPKPPRRVAQVVRLRPEHEAEYRRLHRQVWPSVLRTLTAAHVTNYSIFLRDGLLFAYFEYTGDDFAADQARIAADPQTRRWCSPTPASSRWTALGEGNCGPTPRRSSTWTDRFR